MGGFCGIIKVGLPQGGMLDLTGVRVVVCCPVKVLDMGQACWEDPGDGVRVRGLEETQREPNTCSPTLVRVGSRKWERVTHVTWL